MRTWLFAALLLTGCSHLHHTDQSLTDQNLVGCQGTIAPTAQAIQHAAFICLEQGEIERAKALLEHPSAAQQHADYNAYLKTQISHLALANEADPAVRLQAIKRVHGQYVALIKRYPASAYLANVKTQLLALHSMAAQAEYAQALDRAQAGQKEQARLQMQHITEHYRYGDALRQAQAWLAEHAD